MTKEDNDKTMVRTRRMPFRPAPNSDPDQSVNVLPVGTHLGEFEILDLIGEGGFGIVYLAYDHSLERHVALKEYMPSGLATRTTSMAVTVRSQHNAATFTAGLKSFINEARMLAQFDSPSLVKVHRFWEGNGTAYMVMPFYEGITLKRALKERRITPSEPWIRLLLADLFDAIDTIHRAQCLHRDIAPDNILLLKDGRPLLLDFGAARRVIGDLTQCLTVILKPGFAPIEQYADIAGLRQGAWTDIYALAAVVYFLITGKAPPPAVARMVHDELVPAREAGKGRYSPGFLAVLDKALSVKPEQRFRSIEELRRALDIMETVPRTLPRVTSQWDTTAVRTTRIAEQKPNPPPAARAEEKHTTVPPITPGIRSGNRPRTEPHLDPAPEPEREAEPAPAAPSDGQWQQAWGLNRTVESGPQRDKPAWLVLGLLLTAGIASGVYLGTHQPWREPSGPTTAASSGTTMQSSGASEVPEEEPASQASANASPAPAAPPSPPAASTSPAPTARAPARAPQIAATDSGSKAAELPASSRAPAAPPRPPSERELWQEADASDTSSAYEKYLDAYPKGRHAAAARRRLESRQPQVALSEPSSTSSAPEQTKPKETPDTSDAAAPSSAKSGASPAEEDLWKTATGINAAPAYEAYLNVYPAGSHAPAARDKLASIKRAEQVEESAATPRPAMPKPQATEQAKAPEKADKLASIKPSESSASSPPTSAPEATPKPETRTSGKKTLTMDDKTVLTGDFTSDPKTGVMSGTGKVVWTNGNQYEGTLVRGKKEGQGKFIWTNGQRYSGEWARDMPNGKGTIVFADGSRYEGEVKDGVPHGHGTTRFKSGDVYSGEWVRGKSQGQGRYTWANGSYWEGEFRDDKRTDNGKLVFSENALRAARDEAAARSRGAQEKQGGSPSAPVASETR
ncbi:protein kinase domain-containing protein [Noviherbaspirillum sp.]|uniref:protein kinase domain-containing protein n=1 Tax=Noviherbaspirillum sp. TaxID=1926288 RepID=UPI002B49147F|nr:protein kinase [Noviherbaspirillum sp.]HJV81802.1 protein kinase [Noviherbaspirillum sp.]